MTTKNIVLGIIVLAIIGAAGYVYVTQYAPKESSDATVSEQTGGAAMGKINIDAVCEGALAYTSFPDGASADAFVADCKAGKHPEVIERYKAELNLGSDAAI